MELNISDCDTGADLVQKFMDVVQRPECRDYTKLYQQYTYNTGNPDKLYIYDDYSRFYNEGGGTSSFEPYTRTINGSLENQDVTVNLVSGEKIVFENKDLYIQSSTEAGQGFYIQRACISTLYLGISAAGVGTVEAAQGTIAAVKNANRVLNGERAMVGAQQNRCEKAINVNKNSAENTEYAESRIRDTDMAMEMVALSNQNIIQQAGQTILAQANQSNQGVLSLLG